MEVLIADDHNVIRTVVKKAFAMLEIDRVDEASDGIEAIEMIQCKKYDLIVMDWNMPKMDGIDVVRKARKLGVKCPIIMQTTQNSKNNVMEALRAGVTDYLLKPFSKEDVKDKLEKQLANHF